jgi:hypothetical protein
MITGVNHWQPAPLLTLGVCVEGELNVETFNWSHLPSFLAVFTFLDYISNIHAFYLKKSVKY